MSLGKKEKERLEQGMAWWKGRWERGAGSEILESRTEEAAGFAGKT